MKKIYELYEGINLNDDPFDPIDKIMWAKYKEKLDQDILNVLKKSIVDR